MRRTILAELPLCCSNADNLIEARPCRARQSIGRTLIIPFGRVEDNSIAPSAALEWNAAIGKRPSPWAEEIDDEPSNGTPGPADPSFGAAGCAANGGAAVVACAAAMPLIVFAVAVAVDYANVARFTTRVQLAADAAAAAVSKTIARNPNVDGRDVDQIAERIVAFVFARNAPPGAHGAPTVATTGRASVVTTTVGYQGVAPSNFGSALGYGAISVKAAATSPGLVANSRAPPAP